MNGYTIDYDLFFDKNKSEWNMKPYEKKGEEKKLGEANITYYLFDQKYYVIVTIDKIFYKKLKNYLENRQLLSFFKFIRDFNILDKNNNKIGNSFYLTKNYLLPEEEKYHCTMKHIKNNYKVNGYLVPEEIWQLIQQYLQKVQKNICVYYDDNIECCTKSNSYNFYMYGINVRENKDFFVLPYWHSKKEARKAIAKYLSLDNNNIGLFLYKKGNLYGDQDKEGEHLVVFYNYLQLFKIKINTIHFINTNGDNIYSNKILKYGNKKYKINKIVYN